MARPALLRLEILDLLEQHHLLTVPELLVHLQQKGINVNKTSVYRSLESLLQDALVQRQSFGENQVSYELRRHHHDHLVCEKCGTVSNAPCLVNLPAQIGSFQVSHHGLTVFGVCRKCQ